MKRTLLAVVALSLLAGCSPAPSTPIAPDVEGPDFTKMSGKEMLEYKKGHEPKTGQ